MKVKERLHWMSPSTKLVETFGNIIQELNQMVSLNQTTIEFFNVDYSSLDRVDFTPTPSSKHTEKARPDDTSSDEYYERDY